MDFNQGDEVLQVGYFHLTSVVNYYLRQVRMKKMLHVANHRSYLDIVVVLAHVNAAFHPGHSQLSRCLIDDDQTADRAAMAGARRRVSGFLAGVTSEVEVTDSLSSVSAP